VFTCISLTADTVDVAMTTISYKVPTKCLTGPICRFGVRDHGDRWQQQTISIGRAKITALSIHHAVCSFGQPCIWQRKTVPTAKCFFQVRQLGYLFYTTPHMTFYRRPLGLCCRLLACWTSSLRPRSVQSMCPGVQVSAQHGAWIPVDTDNPCPLLLVAVTLWWSWRTGLPPVSLIVLAVLKAVVQCI